MKPRTVVLAFAVVLLSGLGLWAVNAISDPAPDFSNGASSDPGDWEPSRPGATTTTSVVVDADGGVVQRDDEASVISGAQIPQFDPAVTLHVDADAGDDESSGNQPSEALQSIGRALEVASELRKEGEAVRILLHPAVYRESFTLLQDPDDSPLLVIEAREPGTAVISGADVWTAWTWDTESESFVHTWEFDWGADKWPFEDQPAPDIFGIGGRRELVVVDGVRLEQVEGQSQLRDGTFFVDESADRIHLRPPAGGAFSGSSADVALRGQLMNLDSVRNVVVRGLTFQHAASPFNTDAVRISNSRNVVFESNQVVENSWTGLGVSTSSMLTISRNEINRNGGGGVGIFKTVDTVFEGNDTSFNNWRGVAGGWTGWSIAGVKAVAVHDMIIRQHRAWGNAMRGLWLDYDIAGVVIEDSVWCENLLEGLFLEAILGPVKVGSSQSCNNFGHGVVLVNAYGVTIRDATICGNQMPALYMNAEPGGRSVTTDTGVVDLEAARDLTITGSVFSGDAPLLDMSIPAADFESLLPTLTIDSNRWLRTGGGAGFEFPGGSGDIDEWRTASGQDFQSEWDGSASEADCAGGRDGS